jgi:hypothetical protein
MHFCPVRDSEPCDQTKCKSIAPSWLPFLCLRRKGFGELNVFKDKGRVLQRINKKLGYNILHPTASLGNLNLKYYIKY